MPSLVEGNVFYNAGKSGAEQLSIISASSARILDNVFFDDFAGSGRPVDETTGPLILIGAGSDPVPAEDVTLRGNVFYHFEGSSAFAFVQIGNTSFGLSARTVVVENNLLIGDSSHTLKTPIDIQGVEDVLIRHNTVTGAASAQNAGFRVTPGGGPTNNVNLLLTNNVWSSESNTMDLFSWVSTEQTVPVLLVNNLYYNGGSAIPVDASSSLNAQDDPSPHWGDPMLPSLPVGGLVPTGWDSVEMHFADPSGADYPKSIDEVRRRLVERYGTPNSGTAASEAADPSETPADDILGNPRPATGSGDLGAVELP